MLANLSREPENVVGKEDLGGQENSAGDGVEEIILRMNRNELWPKKVRQT